ncbi:MAG: hypothetical protein WDO72_05960 [Pseudomonadota bacterium]
MVKLRINGETRAVNATPDADFDGAMSAAAAAILSARQVACFCDGD